MGSGEQASNNVDLHRVSPIPSELVPFARFPLPRQSSWAEGIARRLKWWGPVWCPVCGRVSLIVDIGSNLRESCKCIRCRSTSRQRQLAFVVCSVVGSITSTRLRSLKDVAALDDYAIYNTEASRQIHKQLVGMKNYVCSEYFGEEYVSGEIVKGIMHQDLMHLSLEDESIDLVISSDVFEHIPDPYRAHREVFRVLRTGGRHIFTVPFLPGNMLDDVRSFIDLKGECIFVKEPIYHDDPIRKEGTLVHRIFALEMLVNLAKIGFVVRMYHISKASLGIFGPYGLVFEAVKRGSLL